MYSLHVIIVTYNAMQWAERCFSSLRKSAVPVQTIVVDNGSTDGTQEFIKSNFPEVDFIQSPENLGFGKANNIGIEKAYKNRADFFYLMNQDAWVFEDSFEKMLKFYDSYNNKEEIGIISPVHLDGSEKKLDIFLDKYIAHNFENRLISDLFTGEIKDSYELKFINAAHWLLPKQTVEKVGGFNPYFFHYGEDNEYVNRLHYHQKKIFLVPGSRVVHDGKQQLDKVDYNKYTDLTVDTKIMDPGAATTLSREISSLKQGIIKNILTRNASKNQALQNTLNRIKTNGPKMKLLRSEIISKPHAFLNL